MTDFISLIRKDIDSVDFDVKKLENNVKSGKSIPKKNIKDVNNRIVNIKNNLNLQITDKTDSLAQKNIQEINLQLNEIVKKIDDLGLTLQEHKLSLIKDPSLQSSTSSRLLFHIHADEFGKESKLQGMPGSGPLLYLNNYLQREKSRDFPLIT